MTIKETVTTKPVTSDPKSNAPQDEAVTNTDQLTVADPEHCTEALDYVNRLIASMNGNSTYQAPVPMLTKATVESSKAESTEEKSTPSVAATTDAPKTSSTDEDHEPPTVAPIREPHRPVVMAADMKRLREAVKISTNGVLNMWETRNLYRVIYAYLVLATGMISASVLLIGMSNHINSTAYYAAVMATCTATLATWKYLRSTRRLVELLKHQDRDSVEIPAF